jgi:hypothetical protein
MLKLRLSALALAGAFVAFTSRGQFADTAISYNPGSGVTAGYTDPTRALGSPSIFIGYQNADPFNPPYRTNDLVALGTGGSLTLRLSTPIQNDPAHPYGLDFLIFGHAGFMITDWDVGTTDGTFFTGGTAVTRVSVSADGNTFYTLSPSLAPNADGLFPTDASGDFFLPVNPALTAANFAGLDLAGVPALYAGSGGGTGYDLAWAQDANNQSVSLSSVSFVRVDVLSGPAYLDAIAVVPEPPTYVLGILGAVGLLARGRRKT